MTMSVDFLAEASRTYPRIHPILEWTLPSGEVKRLGSAGRGFLHPDVGFYEPLVTRWPVIRKSVADQNLGIELPTAEVTLVDKDGWLSILRATGSQLTGTQASFKLAAESKTDIDPSEWEEVYLGECVPPFRTNQDRTITVTFRPRVLKLSETLPRYAFRSTDWQNLDPSIEGRLAPIIWGNRWYLNWGKNLPLYRVDTAAFIYTPGMGYYAVAQVVDKDGAAQSASTYSTTYQRIGGNMWTLITFTSDPGDGEFSISVKGREDSGIGTGDLIVDPIDFLEDVCRLIWETDTPPINSTSFAAVKAQLASRAGGCPMRAGFVLDTATSGVALLQKIAQSFQIHLYWDASGQLTPVLFDPTAHTAYPTTDRMREPEHFRNPLVTDLTHDLYRGVVAGFALGGVSGEEPLSVLAPTSPVEPVDSVSLETGVV